MYADSFFVRHVLNVVEAPDSRTWTAGSHTSGSTTSSLQLAPGFHRGPWAVGLHSPARLARASLWIIFSLLHRLVAFGKRWLGGGEHGREGRPTSVRRLSGVASSPAGQDEGRRRRESP